MTRAATLFLLLLSCASASAQFPQFPSSNVPVYSGSSYASVDELVNAAQTRIDELSRSTLPKNEIALSRELDRVENEINNASSTLLYYNTSWKPLDQELTRHINKLERQYDALLRIDCNTRSDTYFDVAGEYNGDVSALQSYSQYFASQVARDLVAIQVRTRRGLTESDACLEGQKRIGDEEYRTQKKAVLDAIQSSAKSGKAEVDRATDATNKLAEALKSRRRNLQEALNSGSPQQRITANLPWILVILGTACVLAIVGVRLFDPDIQMEWVASGQVIQFVTVMVLLSVITALALSEVLKENTLGTLLGGVAGYVLAQGVGRAAARDVTRAQRRRAPDEAERQKAV